MKNYLFCFNIVGLSPLLLSKLIEMPHFSKLMKNAQKADLNPVFPGLTLPAQASFSTGTTPAEHGIVANGFYYRDRFEVSFWDQYRSLVQAEPLWETLKHNNPDLKTAVLFFQNTLYCDADFIITPKPMHTDEGLVQWCYSKPAGLYETVCDNIGRPFNLMDYWGPFASPKASEWIMEAAIDLVTNHFPDFMSVYLPHLDYSCQKLGPDDPKIDDDLKVLDNLMGEFLNTLEDLGIMRNSTLCIFSEYSLTQVTGAVFLNKALRKAGFLNVREIEGREYLDFELSRAFAMVDHQIAHIFIRDENDINPVKALIQNLAGVDQVLAEDGKKEFGINHERAGELIAISAPDQWFAYYWWESNEKAPDFATHIDIHRKPGYDPLELFMDMTTMEIPQKTELLKGSHGAPPKDGQGMAAFMVSGAQAGQISLPDCIETIDIALILKQLMDNDDTA